jgi:hypothetical protein
VDLALPVLLVAGGEIVLALVGLRVVIWAACAWRDWRAIARGTPRGGGRPRGPRGGLRALPGAGRRARARAPLRAAA